MKLKIEKIDPGLSGAVGHDLVFAYLPHYSEGHIIWLENIWLKYQYQWNHSMLFPRVIKRTIEYKIYNEEGKN